MKDYIKREERLYFFSWKNLITDVVCIIAFILFIVIGGLYV